MRIEAKKVNNRSWYQRTVKVRESQGERASKREGEWQRERRTRTTHEKRERESARLPVFQNNTFLRALVPPLVLMLLLLLLLVLLLVLVLRIV